MSNPRVVSFFAGIGGICLGFQQAGFDVVAAFDFDKYAVQTYRHNVGDYVQQRDIKEMTWEELPESEVWTFGFPCTDLSVAGRREGMKVKCLDCNVESDYEDYHQTRSCPSCGSKNLQSSTRSGLFYEVMRLLDECQEHAPEKLPKVLIAENVKPLKKYLPALEEEYEFRGYSMQAQLFNSKYWYVPQNRERYYVVGIHESVQGTFAFPEEQHEFIPKLSSVLEPEVEEKYYISDEKAGRIIEQAMKRLPKLSTVHACLTPARAETRQQGRRAKGNEEPMFTLTAQDVHGVIAKNEGEKEQVGVLVSSKHGIREVEQSCTLDACYYKGLGSRQNRPGVLEIEQDVLAHLPEDCELAIISDLTGEQVRELLQETYTTDDGASYCLDANYVKGTSPGDVGKGRRTHVVEFVGAVCLTECRTEEAKKLRREYREKYGKDFCPRRAKEVKPREDGVANCVTATQGIEQTILETRIQVVGLLDMKGQDVIRRVYDPEGLAPTLTTMQGGHRQPKILVKDEEGCDGNLIFVGGVDTAGKRLEDGKELSRNFKEGYRVYDASGIGCCLKANGGGPGGCSGLYLVPVLKRYRVRKLTPIECGRLQGFPMDTWEQVVSNSQAYKQFGNSVTVPLVKAIAEKIRETLA